MWHARELTYAVAAPARRFGSLRAAYLEIHGMLAVRPAPTRRRASFSRRRAGPGLDAGACFSHPVGGDLIVRGRKVVGSAQVREGDALLQHGSILLEDDQRVVGSSLAEPCSGRRVGPLRDLLGREISEERGCRGRHRGGERAAGRVLESIASEPVGAADRGRRLTLRTFRSAAVDLGALTPTAAPSPAPSTTF